MTSQVHGRWPDPVEGHLYHVMDLVPGLPLDEWPETRTTSFLQLAEAGRRWPRRSELPLTQEDSLVDVNE